MNISTRLWFKGGSLLKGIAAKVLLIVHVELKAKGGPLRSLLKINIRYVFVLDTLIVKEVKNNEKCCDFPITFTIKWVQLLLMYGFFLIIYFCHYNHTIFQECGQMLDFLMLVVYAKCSHTVVFDISTVSSTLRRRHLWLWLANADLIVDYHNNVVKAVSFCWGGTHFIKYRPYGYYDFWGGTWCL